MTYAAYAGDGSPTRFADWTLRVLGPDGAVELLDVALPHAEIGAASVEGAIDGALAARLESDDGAVIWDVDLLNVVAGGVEGFSPGTDPGEHVAQASIAAEAGLLAIISDEFTAASPLDDYALPGLEPDSAGDVYPDVKQVMNTVLGPMLVDERGTSDPSDDLGTLDAYNVLVVGSNVAHESFTSSTFKEAARRWVAAGGTLIVLGSGEQNFRWLHPISEAGIVTASGGLYAIDEGNPILNSPNVLDYVAYRRISTWSLHAQDFPLFTHVLREGTSDSDPELLAVSNAGSFGLGRVILSGYQPFDLTSDQASKCEPTPRPDCQSLMFLQNMVAQGYRQLLLDFGPPIPEDGTAGAAHRVVLVHHPDLGGMVAVKLSLYVFPL